MHEHSHVHDGSYCDHDHHDHANAHVHAHDPSHADEMLEQLITVGLCGAFGIVGILLGYQAIDSGTGMLKLILAKPFWIWVLGGGIALTVLSVIRGIVLLRSAGQASCCNHSHETGEHSHGSVFWRAVILMFPLILFAMGLPNQGFSAERIAKMLGPAVALNLNDIQTVAEKETLIPVSFEDVANALRTPIMQETLSGQRTELRGQLQKISDREFTLYTIKMTCCSSDSVPLKARIIISAGEFGGSLGALGFKDGDWLLVRGVLQFVVVEGRKEPLPVVRTKLSDITTTTPDL
jgi:hypothetical protein